VKHFEKKLCNDPKSQLKNSYPTNNSLFTLTSMLISVSIDYIQQKVKEEASSKLDAVGWWDIKE
jgi:hypothetical protein